ncbi:hypothetical protein P389DRAFT_177025 [Cystobasidium minutum MCA 4210]|uniref:uncharacterized protein n=1 Tax=Cystobasidium minutum MCA 4210 TaxID=1397322 RepID=UPI0034CE2365|eukprot:jgi/Rhomi1/177025/fgenesh1_pg.1_\
MQSEYSSTPPLPPSHHPILEPRSSSPPVAIQSIKPVVVVVGGVADSTMPFDPDKSAASSLFVEHLEDATPSHEDMEAFDCFSPGSYISSRRQSVDLAKYESILSNTSHDGGGSVVIPPPTMPSSKGSSSSNRPSYSHARVYSQNAGMPFAALVRRLSYTSSRIPARYSNPRHMMGDGKGGYASKRPKTSSGHLGSSSSNSTWFSALPASRGDQNENGTDTETPVKVIQEGEGDPSKQHAGISLNARGCRNIGGISQTHSTPTPSRPAPRRRSKSGEATIAAASGSIKYTNLAGIKKGKHGKGHHRRPHHPLRSMSFVDELLLKTSGNKRGNTGSPKGSRDTESLGYSRSPLAPKGVNAQQSVERSTTTGQLIHTPPLVVNRPMTPDHEIEAALAKHDYRRMSMPNLPTPPPSKQQERPIWPAAEEGGRASVDGLMKHDTSPLSIGLRTPSPVIIDSTGGVSYNHGSRDVKERPTTAASSSGSSPGWPWNRRNSNSSLTSLLLSPRISASKPSSPAPSPSALQSYSTPAYQGSDSSFFRLDKTPSPNLPLRASPLSQQSDATASETDGNTATSGKDTPRSASRLSTRPGFSKRSLSTSFIMLGRKVASLGNSQAFTPDGGSPRGCAELDASLSSQAESRRSGSPVASGGRDGGIGPSDAVSPPPKSSSGKKEWPWRHRAHTPSSPLSASTASSPLQEEVQWSFKVHGAWPAASPSPALTSPSHSSSSSSPTVQGKRPSVPNTASPVYTRSPLGMEAGDTYFTPKETTESSKSPFNLLRTQAQELPSPYTEDTYQQLDCAPAVHRLDSDRRPSDFLSPVRANHVAPAQRSFIVDSRPKLYRGSKSDDGGLAARSDAADIAEDTGLLSTSAPNAGAGSASSMSRHGRKSPGRQVSPSPSRNLTKIPEADEHDLSTRRESWLASLRGRPVSSKRRMSAADVFGLPSPSRPVPASTSGLPVLSAEQQAFGQERASQEKREYRADIPKNEICELDFTKKPVFSTPITMDSRGEHVNSPTRCFRAISNPATPQSELPALRSRAVSHSSLLSASRPTTPAVSHTSTPAGMLSKSLFPVTNSVQNRHEVFLRRPHRHTQSMPAVPQIDYEVTGLGAPESSVASDAQAKFARVLKSAQTAAASASTSTSTPASKPRSRQSISVEDKDKLRQALAQSDEFEHAVEDEEGSNDTSAMAAYASPRDDPFSPNMRRTPKLSYATSSSADSHPSTVEPPVTGARYRMLDASTPVRGGAKQAGIPPLSQQFISHEASPSTRTCSSISNPNGPKNAFDILLSSRGLDSIDGLPQSKVHEWARRDGSDDSAITAFSDTTSNDGRARDVFDEGRVSVW